MAKKTLTHQRYSHRGDEQRVGGARGACDAHDEHDVRDAHDEHDVRGVRDEHDVRDVHDVRGVRDAVALPRQRVGDAYDDARDDGDARDEDDAHGGGDARGDADA